MPLEDYIELHYPSAKAFAEEVGVSPSTVTTWKARHGMVVNNELYFPYRAFHDGVAKKSPDPGKHVRYFGSDGKHIKLS